MMEAVARWGWQVEVLCGSRLDRPEDVDLEARLDQRGIETEHRGGGFSMDARGVRADVPTHLTLTLRSVPVTVHQGPTTMPHEPEPNEAEEFLRLFENTLERFRPDVLVGYGGHSLARTLFARAMARGVATVFALHNFLYTSPEPFADVDAVMVPSRFAAEYCSGESPGFSIQKTLANTFYLVRYIPSSFNKPLTISSSFASQYQRNGFRPQAKPRMYLFS